MDESDVVEVEDGQTVNIDVDVPAPLEDRVMIVLQDAESGEELGSISGNGFPVPEVDEIVTLAGGTITVNTDKPVEPGEQELSNVMELYEVTDRKFVYADVEVDIDDQEETAMVSRCFAYLDVEEVSEND